MAPTQKILAEAAGRLVAHAGLSQPEAEALVNAVVAASTDATLEMITGSGPLPSSMTASRAHQLHFACRHAKRMLGQREVEVLFRATPTQARSIIVTMYATYEEVLRSHLRNQMVEDAEVIPTGKEESGLTWTVRFTEPSCFDFALDELKRLGLARWATSSRLAIVVPRTVSTSGNDRRPLKDLGLPEPKT